MRSRTCLAIVLAAGEGIRMQSRRPKVLHAVAGQSLLMHVLSTLDRLDVTGIAIVVGPGHEAVADEAKRWRADAAIYIQSQRRGTAHAVLAAREAIARGFDDIVIAFGDTPLIEAATLKQLCDALAAGAGAAVVGFRPTDPTGYGRLILDDGGRLVAIREEKDASEQERAINLCNGGVMGLAGSVALDILERIDNRNAKGEFYLTDAIEIARSMGLETIALEAAEDELRGVNNRAQLAEVEAVMQHRLRAAALGAGVTMVAPETVFLCADTVFGRDVVIEPHVVFGPGVVVEDDVVIHCFSCIEGAHLGSGASVGPFARLRPGTRIGLRVRIGNFVEVKAATIEDGAKANHLSYIGDARVGEGANVGAGTITCNYDGIAKHQTDIGKGAFIGSNSSLVAPVRIGNGAYIGSGSVITDDVPDHALALGRGRQAVKTNWRRPPPDTTG